MEKGANLADFGGEFGPQANINTARGSDNSEEPANKARHSNWDFSKSSDSSMGSASGDVKDAIKLNVKSSGSKGIRQTKAYGTQNFN